MGQSMDARTKGACNTVLDVQSMDPGSKRACNTVLEEPQDLVIQAGKPAEMTWADEDVRQFRLSQQMLQLAWCGGSIEDIRTLVAARANPHQGYKERGQNLAHFAVSRSLTGSDVDSGGSRCKLLQFLVEEYGIDSTTIDTYMLQTPLFYAARYGDVDSCLYLIQCKCKLQHNDTRGQTAFFYAVRYGHKKCVEALMEQVNAQEERLALVDHVDINGQSPLFLVAQSGHTEVMQLLMCNRVDIQRVDLKGETCLFHASEPCLDMILDAKCNPYVPNSKGRTAISVMAENGLACISNLITRGFSTNLPDDHGWTPLFFAAKSGHTAVCKMLVERAGANPSEADHLGMVARNHAELFQKKETAQYLGSLEKSRTRFVTVTANGARGAKFGTKIGAFQKASKFPGKKRPIESHHGVIAQAMKRITTQSIHGSSVQGLAEKLFNAVAHGGHPKDVAALLEAKANPAAVGMSFNQNLLFQAATRQTGAKEVCELLIHRLVNVDAIDSRFGQTPLFFAVRRHQLAGGVECARYLISSRSNPDLHDRWSQTPLFYAVQREDPACAKLLLAANASVNTVDRNGQTPIFLASKAGAVASVDTLLRANANVASVDTQQMTALFMATTAPIVQLLLDHKCSIDSRDLQSRTALMFAARNTEIGIDVVSALIACRSDVHSTDHMGETCLFHGVHGGHVQVCSLLLERHADASHRNLKNMSAAEAVAHADKPDVVAAMNELLEAHRGRSNHRTSNENNEIVGNSGNAVRDADTNLPAEYGFVFYDANGVQIPWGRAEYGDALKQLLNLCPWLDHWDPSAPLCDGFQS